MRPFGRPGSLHSWPQWMVFCDFWVVSFVFLMCLQYYCNSLFSMWLLYLTLCLYNLGRAISHFTWLHFCFVWQCFAFGQHESGLDLLKKNCHMGFINGANILFHLTKKKLSNRERNSWSSLPGSYTLTIGTHPKGERSTSPFPRLGLLLLWSEVRAQAHAWADECSIIWKLPTDYLLNIFLFTLHTLFAHFTNVLLNQHQKF